MNSRLPRCILGDPAARIHELQVRRGPSKCRERPATAPLAGSVKHCQHHV